MLRAGVLLLLALTAPARAAVTTSGYLKDVWQTSYSALEDRPYVLNTARARATLEATGFFFKAHVDYDHEVLGGNYFRTREYRLFGVSAPETWLTMDQTISTGDTVLWRHRLYRGWVGLETERTTLRFGRQRVAWGTGKLWNPTDILNAYNPMSVERDERHGVDAFYLRQGLGDLSQAELAYAPQDRWPASALLARGKTNWKGFDFALMGGKAAASTSSWILGGDFAGSAGDSSLHGEWSYVELKTRAPYWKGLIGWEYTFPTDAKWRWLKDASLLAEYLHSGSGESDRRRYNLAAVLTGREVTLAQDYGGLTYSQDVHPLLKLEIVSLSNLDDGSHFFGPSLQWNALDDLYLTVGFQRFGGSRSTEYGRQPNLTYLQGQYFF